MAKYLSVSRVGILAALPRIDTCRPSSRQKNSSATLALAAMWPALLLSRFVKNTKPRSSKYLSNTVREAGRFSGSTVDSVMAFGSMRSESQASRNQCSNCTIGSSSRSSRSSAGPVAERRRSDTSMPACSSESSRSLVVTAGLLEKSTWGYPRACRYREQGDHGSRRIFARRGETSAARSPNNRRIFVIMSGWTAVSGFQGQAGLGQAKVAELVDAQDLGSCGVTRESSSLSFRTSSRFLIH